MTLPTKPLREASTPRRGLTRLESAVFVGVSINRFDELVRQGRMPPPRIIGTERYGTGWNLTCSLMPCRTMPRRPVGTTLTTNRPVFPGFSRDFPR